MSEEIEVGQIFYASWGYDQTNIDFVQVVEVSKTGKTVKVRRMNQKILEHTGFMSENVVPNEMYGTPFRLNVRLSEWNSEPYVYLRGTYPLYANDGVTIVSKKFRMGSFWEYKGTGLHQSHYA